MENVKTIEEVHNYFKELNKEVKYTDDSNNEIVDILDFALKNPSHKVRMIVVEGSMFVLVEALGGWAMMPPTGLTLSKELIEKTENIEIIISDKTGM